MAKSDEDFRGRRTLTKTAYKRFWKLERKFFVGSNPTLSIVWGGSNIRLL